jgi:hypothetical protein
MLQWPEFCGIIATIEFGTMLRNWVEVLALRQNRFGMSDIRFRTYKPEINKPHNSNSKVFGRHLFMDGSNATSMWVPTRVFIKS